MRELLVHGMFRSGTTLLSRMLSAPAGNLVVADPFVYFFKAYRSYLAGPGGDPAAPTSDQFMGAERELTERIQRADLSERVPESVRERLFADIETWKSAQHPRLCARLQDVRGETFAELYSGLLELCAELYAESPLQLLGTKLSWCDEYLPALARAFPEMRFALVVRDLRAVVASQDNKLGPGAGKRPLLFYVRHWRKSVAYAQHYSSVRSELRGRVQLVRYEDLVRAPEATLRGLCGELQLEFQSSMLDAQIYRTESESSGWRGNSSYGAADGIHAGSCERWRQLLSDDTRRTLECLAGPELAWLGYELPQTGVDTPLELFELGGEPELEELADWIRPFACCDYLRDPAARLAELAVEHLRREMLDERVATDSGAQALLFPAPTDLAELRRAWLARDLKKPRNEIDIQWQCIR